MNPVCPSGLIFQPQGPVVLPYHLSRMEVMYPFLFLNNLTPNR
jgi:hypothetical protein